MGVVAQGTAPVAERVSTRRRIDLTPRAAVIGVLVGATVGVLLLAGAGVGQGIALIYGGGVALCVTISLETRRGERDLAFAHWLLVVTGLWALSSLVDSQNEALYSIGRLAPWLIEPVLVYLILAFPFGHLRTRTERHVVVCTALVAALLYVPAAFVTEYSMTSPWATVCGSECPENVFAVTTWEGADVLRELRVPLTIALFAWATALVVARARGKSATIRALLGPVAWIAAAKVVVMTAYFVALVVDESPAVLEPVGWAYVMATPALAVAFAAGRLRQRLFAADALEEMACGIDERTNPEEVRRVVARALQDPDLEVLYWVDDEDGHWIGAGGWPASIDPSSFGGDRTVSVVRERGRPVAAVVHDPELPMNSALVQAASRFVLTALQGEDLARRLSASIDDLHHSRARIVSTADAERQRIERDLHDGAQQRLVALRIHLALMAERLSSSARDESIRIQDLEHEVDLTIEELRSFAHGIYPPLLNERGLAETLRAAGRGAPIPTLVKVPALRRHPQAVELTVYFGCMEALQNAAKHGRGATSVSITVHESDELVFEVRDNGQGFRVADVPPGAGLTNIADRLAAVNGALCVTSAPGEGTTIRGTIPL
jgi:signal transduction histidine kinase